MGSQSLRKGKTIQVGTTCLQGVHANCHISCMVNLRYADIKYKYWSQDVAYIVWVWHTHISTHYISFKSPPIHSYHKVHSPMLVFSDSLVNRLLQYYRRRICSCFHDFATQRHTFATPLPHLCHSVTHGKGTV